MRALIVVGVCVSLGCGAEAEIDGNEEVVRAVVGAYWHAIRNPTPGGRGGLIIRYDTAYQMLHPDADQKASVDEFTTAQKQWLETKRPHTLVDVDILGVDIQGESAFVACNLHFGHEDVVYGSVRLSEVPATVQLRRDVDEWAVLSVEMNDSE